MLQLSYIEAHKEAVIAGLKKKHFYEVEKVEMIIALNEARKKHVFQHDEVLAKLNKLSKEIGQLMAQGKKEEANAAKEETVALKERGKGYETELVGIEKEIEGLLVTLPNLPAAIVPEGKSPEENVVVRSGGEIPTLQSGALPHWDIATQKGIIDFETGAKITGSGFPLYRGKGARLQRALIQFFLDEAVKAGYEEIVPPFLVNADSAFGTGQLPDKEGQMYETKEEGFYLIPTAEVPVTNILRDQILREEDLPKKFCAYSPCFRREAGSFGKAVRGLNRVHQFDKVEIVQVVAPEVSYTVLEEMVAHVEQLLHTLELPYRILRLCGGDMSFASALTYDFEVYSAAQERWLEVSSVSNFETFQSNRMKLRMKGADGKNVLLHTLNGSALALPRIVAALLENKQNNGIIWLPEVLHAYTGFETL